ncbi:hypothetical protein PCARR_b0096 [Pseudoalteromonas carrageenovora IAM 12662]|uniref:Uncharacterized protein n=1 Tax=Pseudoalteromonas carrageenovora IAM 12662 TaxID=1314868 RepID=A0ABR9EUC6_PSEVC|nr:hypothetical protein [Pseudoalteromonas carrageenovora IAM 12662]
MLNSTLGSFFRFSKFIVVITAIYFMNEQKALNTVFMRYCLFNTHL